VIGVSYDPVLVIADFAARRNITFPLLSDPGSSTIYRWKGDTHVATEGPYAETKEHLAGFFLVDVESRERAEEIAAAFAHPGDVIELRPAMWAGGPDA